MNKITSYILLSFILLIGCKKYENNKFTTKYIKEEAVEYSLSPQLLPIDILNPTGIVAIDTFLVFVQRHENKIIKVYSVNDYKILGNFLRKGNGPNEIVLFTRFNQFFQQNNESLLWIQSYPNFMGLLNINKSIKNNNTFFEKKVDFTKSNDMKNIFEESNAVFELSDSVFLLTKDPIRSQTFKENTNPFYVKLNYCSNIVYDTIYINNLKGINFENNLIYSDYPVIKPNRDKIALFYTYMDAIIIIDLNTKNKTKIGLSNMGLNTKYAIEQKKQIHYEAFATDSLLFGLRKDKNNNSVLYTYDWNGVFKYKLYLNANVLYFSINEKNKTLYGIDEDDHILAYDLKDI